MILFKKALRTFTSVIIFIIFKIQTHMNQTNKCHRVGQNTPPIL